MDDDIKYILGEMQRIKTDMQDVQTILEASKIVAKEQRKAIRKADDMIASHQRYMDALSSKGRVVNPRKCRMPRVFKAIKRFFKRLFRFDRYAEDEIYLDRF